MKKNLKKKSLILGLNAFGFNTSTTLIKNGKPIFSIEEERVIREKRTRKFPIVGIRQALKYTGHTIEDVEAVAISWNPAINLELLSPNNSEKLRYIPEAFYSVPSYLINMKQNKETFLTKQKMEFIDGVDLEIYYLNHHICHASSYYLSPFNSAAVLTVDAFGEKQSSSFSIGSKKEIRCIWSQEFPHSLGSFYSTFTQYCGFSPQSDEWKLMGAAPYGNSKSKYYKRVRSLVELNDQGFLLNLEFFNHYQFHRPNYYSKKMIDKIGIKPNIKDMKLTKEYYDLAAAAQRVFEEIYFHLLNLLYKKTKLRNVVIAGGSALNSVANGKVLSNTPFKNIFVPPVPDDSGGSIGAAYYLYHHLMGHERNYEMKNNYLGLSFDDNFIEKILRKYSIKYRKLKSPEKNAARMIADGKIIAWFQGRLEYGDRALGNRSILADPRDESMKDKINASIKYREPFRPFAPAVLNEKAKYYFENHLPTPFMEKVYKVKKDVQKKIPAVTHIDGSGRIQTVDKKENPLFYSLIKEFEKITQIPIVVNTSFNLKGEAMVCYPDDAIRTFFTSGLNALFIGSFLIEK